MAVAEFTQLKTMSSAMRESLRALRTNIQFCGDDVKTILFTSTVPNEGKSTVVLDLARSIGAAGQKVLILDTDMRKSIILSEYSVRTENHEQIFGLSHYLSGQKKMEESIYSTNMEHVDIIFAGRSVPNPTEILGKKYFTDLLEYGRENYDYVLVDCAPVTAAIDAVLVAHYCDGAMLVIAQGEVSSRAIADSKRQLESSGVRILGAVLNKVQMDNSHYGRYYGKYYGNYYGKYYGHYGHYGHYGSEGSAAAKNGDGSVNHTAGDSFSENGSPDKAVLDNSNNNNLSAAGKNSNLSVVGESKDSHADNKSGSAKSRRHSNKKRK